MAYSGLNLVAKVIKESPNLSLFDYGNATYEIIFHHASQQAVDEWLDEIALINNQYKVSELVRYIVNTAQLGNEEMPILYVFRRSQEYVKTHPLRPITRTLIFHSAVENKAVLSILNIFSTWLSNRQQESALFLPINREDEGIEWLLRE